MYHQLPECCKALRLYDYYSEHSHAHIHVDPRISSVSTTHHMQVQTHNLQFSWRQLLCVLEESVSLVNYLNVSIDILFLGQSPAQKKSSYAIWNTKPSAFGTVRRTQRNESDLVQKQFLHHIHPTDATFMPLSQLFGFIYKAIFCANW